jgi:fatty acid desaturase
MQTFRTLSYGEKRRVTRLVAKGEAPQDPRMAVAAVELAERYQRREQGAPQLFRAMAILLAIVALGLGVLAAVRGDVLLTISMTLLLLTNLGHLAFNPAARPRNVARSLEASRQVSAAAGG